MDAWYNCQTVGISRGHELWCQQGTSSTRIRACLERAKLNGLRFSSFFVSGLALSNAMQSALLTAQFGAHRHQIDVAGALVSVQVVPCLSSVNAMCRRRVRGPCSACGALHAELTPPPRPTTASAKGATCGARRPCSRLLWQRTACSCEEHAFSNSGAALACWRWRAP